MKCTYPQYQLELPQGIMQKCVDMAPKLLGEVGFSVENERFLSHLEGKSGIRIKNGRVYFEEDLVGKYIDKFKEKPKVVPAHFYNESQDDKDWTVTTAGYSMMVIDVASEKLREATCQDLRDLIKLANSFGIGGDYMVMPQDVPPLMRAIECYKICFESSTTISPGDYQQPVQLPFIYEMHQLLGKPMDLYLVVPSSMSVDPKDLDNFLEFYPLWKKHRNIKFNILDYGMVGITKPITITGCATMCFTEMLAIHILLNLFDPELSVPIGLNGGHATDMKSACWAFGSPRSHLFRYLGAMLVPNLCGCTPDHYTVNRTVRLETSSSAIDEQAALEKMATGLVAALQGARNFGYAGTLCVDDIYSGIQFVIDLEIVNYIRETIGAFEPHPDIIDIEGLYKECRDVALGKDAHISHINTVKRFRNVIPSSDLIVREKLQSWLTHRKLLKDRAREIAMDRIKNFEPYHLPYDKQKELDKIYERAKAVLST